MVFRKTIYKISPGPMPAHTLAHEIIHVAQQAKSDPLVWWIRYILSPKFRYKQELPAYQNEYQYFVERIGDRNELNRILIRFAAALSGPLYNKIVDFDEAMRAIKDGK